jgi:hypothetical protein
VDSAWATEAERVEYPFQPFGLTYSASNQGANVQIAVSPVTGSWWSFSIAFPGGFIMQIWKLHTGKHTAHPANSQNEYFEPL